MYRCRIALGSLLIQTILKTTYQETVAQIRENPYLQYFPGLKAYTMKPVLDSSRYTRVHWYTSESDQARKTGKRSMRYW
ncbi:MAG TPA: transposase [Thermotogota bacterium]|nr:transposase [Thermotogota bacterium]